MWNFWRAPRAPKSTELVDYRIGRRFDPGAPAEVFEQVFTNPIVLFRGRGRVAGSLYPLQPAQVWFGPQLGVQSLGGVQTGQYVGQPLIDPAELDITGGE
jgi:hypothetical protein